MTQPAQVNPAFNNPPRPERLAGEAWRASAITITSANRLPLAMRERAQWVVWKFEQRAGKITKVPYRADGGGRASSTDANTWATLEGACAGLKRDSSLTGIGFVFAPDLLTLGIDLDKCRDAGQLNLGASALLAALPATYTEVSPSKTGLKLFYRLSEPYPFGGKKTGDIEVYGSMRYFTVTGWRLACAPSEMTLIENLEAITSALPFSLETPKAKREARPRHPTGQMPIATGDDAQVMARAASSKTAARFLALYGGSNLEFNRDANEGNSEGDLALANYLWFYSGGSEGSVDRLFRLSSRMRAKWDERHSGDGRTYGQMTIDKAAANLDVWKPKKQR